MRSKKSFLGFFALLALLLFIFQQNWNFILQSWKITREISQSNRWLFFGLAQAHLYFLAIFTPFLFAPLIAEERERGTFELLAASPLTISHILAAKHLARTFYFLLMLAGTLPVLSLALVGGGVSAMEIGRIYLLIAAAFFFFGGLGTFCSTLSDRVSRVYILTGLAAFIFTVVLPNLLTIIAFFYNGFFYYANPNFFLNDAQFLDMNRLLENISPFAAIRMEFFPERVSWSSITLGSPPSKHSAFFINLIWSGNMAIAFYALALARMNRLAQIDPKIRKKKKAAIKKEGKFWSFLNRDVASDLSEAVERRHERMGSMTQRFQWFFRYGTLIRISYIGVIVSLLTIPVCTTKYLFLMPLLLPIPFMLPMAASGVSSEKERGTWELLRTTMIPARHIVESKIRNYYQYGLALALSFYAPGLLFRLFYPFDAKRVASGSNSRALIVLLLVMYPVVISLVLKAIVAFTLFCSARMRRSHWALMASLACYLFILFGSPGLEKISSSISFAFHPRNYRWIGQDVIDADRLSFGALAIKFALEQSLGLFNYIIEFLSPLSVVKLIFPSASFGRPAPASSIPLQENPFLILIIQLVLYAVLTKCLMRWTARSLERPD